MKYASKVISQYPKIKILTGNHDLDIENTMIIVANDERQIIFNHAIITDSCIELCDVYKHKGDRIFVYKRKGQVKFFHTYYRKFSPEQSAIIDLRYANMIRTIGVKNYNPFIVCGHDDGYIYVSSLIGNTFPFMKIPFKSITVAETVDLKSKNIFHRIISTDGFLPHFWKT